MKLSRPDALLLHAVLFHVSSETRLDPASVSQIKSIMKSLSEYLEADVHDIDDVENDSEVDFDDDVYTDEEVFDDEDEDEDEEDSCTDIPESNESVSPDRLSELNSLIVIDESGQKCKLEFEDVGDDSVDVLINAGNIIYESVHTISLEKEKTIVIYGSLESEDYFVKFAYSRLPKSWSKVMQLGQVYKITNNEENE